MATRHLSIDNVNLTVVRIYGDWNEIIWNTGLIQYIFNFQWCNVTTLYLLEVYSTALWTGGLCSTFAFIVPFAVCHELDLFDMVELCNNI